MTSKRIEYSLYFAHFVLLVILAVLLRPEYIFIKEDPWLSNGMHLFNVQANKPDIFFFLGVGFYFFVVSFLGLISILSVHTHEKFKELRISVFVLLFAGFLPGYFITIALNRIVMTQTPLGRAPIVISVVLICLTVVVSYFFFRTSDWGRVQKVFRLKITDGYVLSFLFLIVLLALVARLNSHSHLFLGDGAAHVIRYISELNQAKYLSLPILFQHYDEPLFAAPFLFGPDASGEHWDIRRFFKYPPILPLYLVNGAGIPSLACLLFVFARMFGFKTWQAFFAISFLVLGAFGLSPVGHLLFIDSVTPLLQNLHIGYAYGAFLPFLIVAYSYFTDRFARRENRFLIALLSFMMGVGISSMAFNNVLYALIGMALCFTYIFFQQAVQKQRFSGRAGKLFFAVPISMVAGTLFTYGIHNAFGLLLFLSLAIGGLSLLSGFFLLDREGYRDAIARVRAFTSVPFMMVGTLYGLVGLGSMAGFKSMELFSSFGIGADVFRGSYVPNKNINHYVMTLSDLFSFYDGVSVFDDSVWSFFYFFGLFLVVVLVGLRLLAPASDTEKPESGGVERMGFIYSFVAVLCCFCGSLFILNFVTANEVTWIYTRFLIVPLVGAFLIFPFVLKHYAPGSILSRVFYAVLVVWTVLPFATSHLPEQFKLNLRSMIEMLMLLNDFNVTM